MFFFFFQFPPGRDSGTKEGIGSKRATGNLRLLICPVLPNTGALILPGRASLCAKHVERLERRQEELFC